jgi:exonuclease SbcD
MKVLHTADLHMDRSFEGLSAVPDQLAQRFIHANQVLLTKIADLAIEQAVDLVIFAGDTFHQSRTSIMMQSFFIEELTRLKEAKIPVALTFGNHDYYAEDRYWFSFPDNVYLFEKEAVKTIHFETAAGETVFVSGFSYQHPWIESNKAVEFPAKNAAADIHIGIYHGEMTKKSSQNYAPFTVSDLKAKGYDYWALGHIHQPQVLQSEPLIVYPGTPQGHTKKERELQGVAIVTIENGHSSVQFKPVATIDWRKKAYSLKECRNAQEVLTQLVKGLTADFTAPKEFSLVEVQLEGLEKLDQTVQLALESGELLGYVQKQVYAKTNEQVFVFALTSAAAEVEHTAKVFLPANPELLNQLEQMYRDPTIFSDTTKELLQHPMVSSLIEVNNNWQERAIAAADHVILEDFLIQEAPL